MNVHLSDKSTINFIKPTPSGPWIVGGAVRLWYEKRSVESHDIDVWFRNHTQFMETDAWFKKTTSFIMVHDSDNAKTYKATTSPSKTIQLIKKQFYKSVDDVLNNFDLTCCQFAYDGKEFFFGETARQDVKNKTLNIVKFNTNIIPRMVKYVAYGYTPSSEMLDMIQSETIETEFTGYADYD